MTKLIIDTLGSDQGPDMVARALKRALGERAFEAVAVGPSDVLGPYFSDEQRVEIVDTHEFISNEEAPVMAIRRKKNASMVLGLNRLNEDGDVFLTAGSTGAFLAGGYFITKRMKGLSRLCLVVFVPTAHGGILFADAGANMDTTPEMLVQFATLTSRYAEKSLGRVNPRVGLLNIGVEADKGDKRALETYQLLQESPLNFVGNVEARDILFHTNYDVLIADGFAGNVAVKTMEGTAKYLMQTLSEVIYSSLKTKLGGLLLKNELKEALGKLDYRNHGGAPLLGARKPLYKAHGNSNEDTFTLAILEALDFAESGIVSDLMQEAEQAAEASPAKDSKTSSAPDGEGSASSSSGNAATKEGDVRAEQA